MAAYIGRWFPGPGNHFCKSLFSHQQDVELQASRAHLGSSLPGKCLFLSGFTEEQLNHMHDTELPTKYKMGFTNMVARATPGSKDLSR